VTGEAQMTNKKGKKYLVPSVRALRDFFVGPLGARKAVSVGDVCEIIKRDGAMLMVKTPSGSAFGWTYAEFWEEVKQ
jgi:hypothetical protein